MPELPTIERHKATLNQKLMHQTIKTVDVKRDKVLKDVTEAQLKKALLKKQFTQCLRYGKLLILETNNHCALILHLGLRGGITIHTKPSDSEAYAIRLTFDNGSEMLYQTLFGNVHLTKNWEDYIKAEHFGPDANAITLDDFANTITHAKGPIKGVLMDQHAIAGLGNLYSDEMLFQAHIDPRTPGHNLDTATIKNLHAIMHDVLKTATEKQGLWKRLPHNYLTYHRKSDQLCPVHEKPLQVQTVAGRSSYFCVKCQIA